MTTITARTEPRRPRTPLLRWDARAAGWLDLVTFVTSIPPAS